MTYTFRRRKEIEETIILYSFGYSSFCASSFMFLNLFDDLHSNVLSLFPINSAPEIVMFHKLSTTKHTRMNPQYFL